MPFINGKFYMNPAYGRTVERARAAESERDAAASQCEQSSPAPGDHWITKDGRHVLIHESQAGQQQRDKPRNQREEQLATIVYNETASLHPGTRGATGRPGSADDLQAARVAVAEIANRVVNSGHPERVAPSRLTPQAAGHLAAGNPDVVAAYEASLAAARQALGGSNTTNGATQYRVRVNNDINTPINKRSIASHFGPFLDKRPGRAPKTIVVAR